MAEKNNATCSICGKGYYKCLSCKGKKSLAPYKMYCCSSEHYKVFQVLHGFNTGVYTKDEAREKLQNIDLSDLNNFKDDRKKLIKDIMKENKKADKVVEVNETIDVVMPETINEPVVAVESQVPSYISRRKKSFEQEDSE